jgi:non-heme Fe2+,alpha-ketoglutarate-dependent halogenase
MSETTMPATAGHHLSQEALDRYRRDGWLSPLTVMSETEMADGLTRLDGILAQRSGRVTPSQNVKVHLLVPFLWDLVHHPAILDPVEDILGPDLLCWGAGFFDKLPGTAKHVPWHQDVTYWGLSEPLALTAWVAFTPSVPENGCMRVSPRTHHAPIAHRDTGDNDAMLPGREEVEVDVDEENAVDLVLKPGEMSLHDVLVVHGSAANSSTMRRCGFAIRYISGRVTTVGGKRGSATLVRGRDHGTYDLEEPPEGEFHPEALKRYAGYSRQAMRIFLPNMAKTGESKGEAQ